MRMKANCISCQLAQALILMERKRTPHHRQIEIIKELNRHFETYDNDLGIAACYSEFYSKMKELLNDPDPYKEEKRRQNEQVAALMPAVRKCVEAAEDSLLAAIKVSVAGNIIDLTADKAYDIEEQIEKSLDLPLEVDDYSEFADALKHAETMLFVADNAGEIVLDRLLIEQIHAFREEKGLLPISVVVVVRSTPILNDAMMEDAAFAEMDGVARVVGSGSAYFGLLLDKVSGEIQKLVRDSDIVLAKGQANFESMIENGDLYGGKAYLLLMVKCRHVSERLNADMHGMALVKAGPDKNRSI
mgnify:CR=1 FL=1